MSFRFYIAGHSGFHNRGCEALVRSIVQIVGARFPGSRFVVPSANLPFDQRQWPDAAAAGVEFVPFYAFPERLRWWNRLYRIAPQAAARLIPPLPDLPPAAAAVLAACDALIVTGGDIISLDYSAASLMRWLAQARAAVTRKIPVILWSSSVGPFKDGSPLEQYIARQLKDYTLLSTRENRTQTYLTGLGLQDVVRAVDPAFAMHPEPPSDSSLLPPTGAKGLLGFNVSPLIAQARKRQGNLAGFEAGVVAFLRWAVAEAGLHIALIPHVDPSTPGDFVGDWEYMEHLRGLAALPESAVKLLPGTLNAAQLKGLIAQCDYFIGARTHATIAALSTGVPTLSIAYSVKARGINEDLFGDTRYMLETSKVDQRTLTEGLQLLVADGGRIRALLQQQVPLWKERATLPAQALKLRLDAAPPARRAA
jgi:polysaccharide pyruvyl transferase WcaK-like protein